MARIYRYNTGTLHPHRHPDDPGMHDKGFQHYVWVRAAHRIVRGGVYDASTEIARIYAPASHPEIPGELAKLRTADDAAVLEFVSRYGRLGYGRMLGWGHGDDPDPVQWIRAHASGMFAFLTLLRALKERGDLKRAVTTVTGLPYGDGLEIRQLLPTPGKPTDQARGLCMTILNANVYRIFRYASVDAKGRDRTFFGFKAPIDVAYWHLADAFDQGVAVGRCEAEGCQGVFIRTDPRQRFCPPRFHQGESPCAIRERVRRKRRLATRLQRNPKQAGARGYKSR